MHRILRSIQLNFIDRLVGVKQPRRAPRKVMAPCSDPELHAQWLDIRRRFFPERIDLDDYVVFWSTRRQKRVLGSCNMQRRQVRVARELNDPLHQHWLEPLLYHEMCHAALGILPRGVRGKRAWHGKEFKALAARHPQTIELDNWIEQGGWRSAVRRNRALKSLRTR